MHTVSIELHGRPTLALHGITILYVPYLLTIIKNEAQGRAEGYVVEAGLGPR